MRKMSAKYETCDWRTHLDRLSTEQIMFNNGLEFHNQTNCLLCFRNTTEFEPLTKGLTLF
jgi:hypothetical protein